MRILCFSPYYFPYISGITTTTEKFLSHYAKHHQVTVLTFKLARTQHQNERLGGVEIVRMPWLFRLSKGFASIHSSIYFFRYVKKSDVVIVNQPNGEALVLVVLAFILRRKIISFFHCDLDLGRGIWNSLLSWLVRIHVFLQLLLSTKIAAYQDYLTGHPYGFFFKSKLVLILPLIDRSQEDKKFQKKIEDRKQNNFYIAYVGRIAREKGLEFLIDAVRTLTKKDNRYTLVFAGPKQVAGEEPYFIKVQKLLKESSIKTVQYGELSKSELSALYKTVDVVVIPSTNRTEAISISQLESMYHGTPVVVSALPGVRYPVTLTHFGIAVKPANADAIVRAIDAIRMDKKSYVNDGTIAKVTQLLDEEKMLSSYDALLI